MTMDNDTNIRALVALVEGDRMDPFAMYIRKVYERLLVECADEIAKHGLAPPTVN
jgi:hypothetical protein